MLKQMTLAVALGTMLAGSAGLVLAQGAGPSGGEGGPRGRGHAPSPEFMQRMLDGRLAMVKTALKLSAEQEKLWPAVEQAIRDNSAVRMKAWEERRGKRGQRGDRAERPDMIERLETMSKRAAERSQQLESFANALKPLYATLSDDQKQVLKFAVAHRRGGGHGGWHHRRG